MRTRNPAGHKPKKRKQQKGNGLHLPTQEAEDQPRAPERDADDDAVADEQVQPRHPRKPLPREALEASANWRALSYLYNRREAGGGGDAVLGQMIAVLLVLFVLHIPKV